MRIMLYIKINKKVLLEQRPPKSHVLAGMTEILYPDFLRPGDHVTMSREKIGLFMLWNFTILGKKVIVFTRYARYVSSIILIA